MTDLSQRNGTLSDKLSGTDGVIRPQSGVDGAIQKAPSTDSRMPVIPPGQSNGPQGGGTPK